jgi:SAM-dependent methyltransferase
VGDYRDSLTAHYAQTNLRGRIERACTRLEVDPEKMTLTDMSNFDQVHIRGLEATLEIGDLAGLKPGMRVLDLGSGLGGPARTMAAEFGCEVVGLDIVKEFCRTADLLTEWAGMTDQVSFRIGDMRSSPFEDGEFDVVVTQHAIMNVKKKPDLFEEVHRVLKPAGGFFLYEICGENDRGLQYPLPWAGTSKMSFLPSTESLKAQLTEAGFTETYWADVSAKALDWYDDLANSPSVADEPPRAPSIAIVLGPEAAKKTRNVERSLREGRIQLIQTLYSS